MLKYIFLAAILKIALLIGFFTEEDIYLQINAPAAAEAGTTVEVELELHKSGITGFARFHQELPPGITASPVYPSDVSFSFDENTLRLIWLNLPRDETVSVRYRLHINERLRGELNLDGTFSYIENNLRASACAPDAVISIIPSPYIDEELIVDINQAGELLPEAQPEAAPHADAVAIRQLPVEHNDEYLVNILINKGFRSRFAKIEERIPLGFTAEEVETSGGKFTFSDQTATITWSTLPPESSFIVTYRLIPDEDTGVVPKPEGEFSFVSNDITASYPVIEREVPLTSVDGAYKRQLIASAVIEARTSAPRRSAATRAPVQPVPATPGKTYEPEPVSPVPPEQGVYYRVQLAAGRRQVNPDSYFKNFDIPFDIHTEVHEGWYKYSIGSFEDYRSARDQRVQIWNTTPVGDAFVSAYSDGVRITVQEALAIAGHRWYR